MLREKESTLFQENPTRFLEEEIKRFVGESPENRLQAIDGSPIFEEPLVAFADGEDPLFLRYKEEGIIGSFHLTPREALEREGVGEVGQVSVISWVLPTSTKTRQTNRQQLEFPSLRWAHTRWFGEKFNDSLRRHVVGLLKGKGYQAVAPVLSPFYQTFNLLQGQASNWSERHMLYAAGLGTFSLSDGFITPKGIAMRCGSVVTDLKLPPSPRLYSSPTANCPFLQNGSCGQCIDRCPAGALSGRGHDKKKCQQYLLEELPSILVKRYGVQAVGCGLCQTRVPCEARIPPPIC